MHPTQGDRAGARRLKLRVEDPPNRKHMVFLGGAVLADIMKVGPGGSGRTAMLMLIAHKHDVTQQSNMKGMNIWRASSTARARHYVACDREVCIYYRLHIACNLDMGYVDFLGIWTFAE